MTPSRPAPTTTYRAPMRRKRVAGLLAVVAVVGVLCDQLLATTTPTSPTVSTAATPAPAPPEAAPPIVPVPEQQEEEARRSAPRIPGAAGLDPDLLDALERAAADAADEGIVLRVDSGRRTPEHQQQLLDEAVVRYGSEEEAARWVAPPDRSAHVSGDAVDIGPVEARTWLSQRGAEYGLCQTYANEPWHFELRADAAAQGCPPMYADPTHDPRLQR